MAQTTSADKRGSRGAFTLSQLYRGVFTANEIKPLPSRLIEKDPSRYLKLSHSGLSASRNGSVSDGRHGSSYSSEDAAIVRTDQSIPLNTGIYYFEATVLQLGSNGATSIGISTKLLNSAKVPGWDASSFWYHSDGSIYQGSLTTSTKYGPPFCENDTIGCGVDFLTKSLFFTRNGIYLGKAFEGRLPVNAVVCLYPSLNLHNKGIRLNTNFGQRPFRYAFKKHLSEEQQAHEAKLIDGLTPGFLGAKMRELVAGYLIHHGYVASAQAFSRWANLSGDSAFSTSNSSKPNIPPAVQSAGAASRTPSVPCTPLSPMAPTVQPTVLCASEPSVDAVAPVLNNGLPHAELPVIQTTTDTSEHKGQATNTSSFHEFPGLASMFHRRRLRALCRRCQYGHAATTLTRLYPRVVDRCPEILVQLRCRQLVEMMHRHALQRGRGSTCVGHRHTYSSDPKLMTATLQLDLTKTRSAFDTESAPALATLGVTSTSIDGDSNFKLSTTMTTSPNENASINQNTSSRTSFDAMDVDTDIAQPTFSSVTTRSRSRMMEMNGGPIANRPKSASFSADVSCVENGTLLPPYHTPQLTSCPTGVRNNKCTALLFNDVDGADGFDSDSFATANEEENDFYDNDDDDDGFGIDDDTGVFLPPNLSKCDLASLQSASHPSSEQDATDQTMDVDPPLSAPTRPCHLPIASSEADAQSCNSVSSYDCSNDMRCLLRQVQFGRSLVNLVKQVRAKTGGLSLETERLLQQSVSLFAYPSPSSPDCPLRGLLDPSWCDTVASLINSAVLMEAHNLPAQPVLEQGLQIMQQCNADKTFVEAQTLSHFLLYHLPPSKYAAEMKRTNSSGIATNRNSHRPATNQHASSKSKAHTDDPSADPDDPHEDEDYLSDGVAGEDGEDDDDDDDDDEDEEDSEAPHLGRFRRKDPDDGDGRGGNGSSGGSASTSGSSSTRGTRSGGSGGTSSSSGSRGSRVGTFGQTTNLSSASSGTVISDASLILLLHRRPPFAMVVEDLLILSSATQLQAPSSDALRHRLLLGALLRAAPSQQYASLISSLNEEALKTYARFILLQQPPNPPTGYNTSHRDLPPSPFARGC